MPYYPGADDKAPYNEKTFAEKLVIDYTGLSIVEVYELDIDIFMFILREAYMDYLSQSEKGREYLENCFRIIQTKPDRQSMRDSQKKEG